MADKKRLTVLIEREGDTFVSLCPELDIASQGATIKEAHGNLKEAVTLFFQSAHPSEISERLRGDIFVTSIEVSVG